MLSITLLWLLILFIYVFIVNCVYAGQMAQFGCFEKMMMFCYLSMPMDFNQLYIHIPSS